jgi:hypothetical protein
MDTMKFGAYNSGLEKGIVWFRTSRPLEAGCYHRHARRDDTPDVCIAESVQELIIKVYPWIHQEETAFQENFEQPRNKRRRSKADIRSVDREMG